MTRSSLSADARGAMHPPLVYGGLRCVRLRLTGRYCIADSPVLKKNQPIPCLQFTYSSELFMPFFPPFCLFYCSNPSTCFAEKDAGLGA